MSRGQTGTDFVLGAQGSEWLKAACADWSTQKLFIVSPFITTKGLREPQAALSITKERRVVIITALDVVSVATGYLDVLALASLCETFAKQVEVYNVNRLHAKVFMLQGKDALVGSANLTLGGLVGNIEIGVRCTSRVDLKTLREHVHSWISQGNRVTPSELRAFDSFAKAVVGDLHIWALGGATCLAAFDDKNTTHPEATKEPCLHIPTGGMDRGEFIARLAGSSSLRSRERIAPLRRLRMLEQLGLVVATESVVSRGPNFDCLLGRGWLKALGLRIIEVYPDVSQVTEALRNRGTITWAELGPALEREGLGHLTSIAPTIIRWMVQLGMIEQVSLSKSGNGKLNPNQIRAFRVGKKGRSQ